MLPSTKPLVTAPLPACLWKPSTAPSAPVLLLLDSCRPPLKTTGDVKVAAALNAAAEAKVVLAYTSRLLLALVPKTELPSALKTLSLLLILTDAVNKAVALTARV